MARGFGASESKYFNPYGGPTEYAKGESPDEIKAAKELVVAKEQKSLAKLGLPALQKMQADLSAELSKASNLSSHPPIREKLNSVKAVIEKVKKVEDEKINAKGVRSSFTQVKKAVGASNVELLKSVLPPKFQNLGLTKPAGTHVAVDYEDLDNNYGDEDSFIRMIDLASKTKWQEDANTSVDGDGEAVISSPGKEPGSKWVFKSETWETRDKINYDPKEWGVKQIKTLVYIDETGRSQNVWERTIYTTQGG